MHDIYLMSKATGELMPSSQAIRDFYKTHGALEAWTDEWEETDMCVENSAVAPPNFVGAVRV